MTEKNINAVIDLGSNKLKCAIFNFDKQESNLIAYSEIKTLGINNSLITNFDEACKSIREIITDLEKKASVNINFITVMLEPTEIVTTRITKFKKMEGVKIENEDINFLLRESKKQLEKNDKTFSQLHMFNYKYIVDDKALKELPINIFCNQLSLENIFISIPKNILKNISEVFNSCNLDINRFICPSYATGIYLLNKNQLENGSGIVDIGYDKTSIALFKNSSLIKLLVLPIGSNHITKDIAKVCSLNLDESEIIKNNIDFSFQNNKNLFDEKDYLKNTYFVNSNFRKISKNLILNVIKARLDEIFDLLKKQLIVPGFNLSSGINLLLTGEESNLCNLEKYCINFFGPNVKTIDKNSNEQNENLEKNFISSLGALKIIKDGWETEAIPETSERNIKKIGFFEKIFSKDR